MRRKEQREGTTRGLAAAELGLHVVWRPAAADLADCEIDHIIPKSVTLIEEDWNKALLHWWCNAEKWNYIRPEALKLAQEHGVDLGGRYVVASPPRELAGL